MEGIFAACRESVAAISLSCAQAQSYKEEIHKLGRHVAKLALVLTELELQMQQDESLRGSEHLFMAGEAAVAAFQVTENLLRQCVDTSAAAAIWPLEDAIEFQSVAVELLDAASKFAALDKKVSLPQDLIEDARHVHRQLQALTFTRDELAESEEIERTEEQHRWAERRLDRKQEFVDIHDETLHENVHQRTDVIPLQTASNAATQGGVATDRHPQLSELKEAPAGIPPPDKELTEALAVQQGPIHVPIKQSSETTGAEAARDPATRASPSTESEFHAGQHSGMGPLPQDPFSMAPGAEAETSEAGRLLSQMKVNGHAGEGGEKAVATS